MESAETKASEAPRKNNDPIPDEFPPPVEADLAETAGALFTPEVRELAESLDHDPLRIFNWVRNEIEFSPIWGSVQGAQGCLENRGGNAFDTSALLVALLRVSGVHARYQLGTIEVPVDAFVSWAGGFSSPEAAASLFASAGVPGVVRRVDENGIVRSVRLNHIWVEAWIDYVPSRGAKHIHGQGDTWISLDASYKMTVRGAGNQLRELVASSVGDVQLPALLGGREYDPTIGVTALPIDYDALEGLYQFDEAAVTAQLEAQFPARTLRELNGGAMIDPVLL
ncbi:MAG: transglutaminase domain-containing protein, partial [Akkermansiaceae bacterium]|nr:transglutaminase domain-containing protein [Akkermansiaceae bacterium]